MSRRNAVYVFVHDGGDTQVWRLKGHAEQKFWQWLASWAVMIRKPSDLGYDDGGFILPALTVDEHIVTTDRPTGDHLFRLGGADIAGPHISAARLVSERVSRCADPVNSGMSRGSLVQPEH